MGTSSNVLNLLDRILADIEPSPAAVVDPNEEIRSEVRYKYEEHSEAFIEGALGFRLDEGSFSNPYDRATQSTEWIDWTRGYEKARKDWEYDCEEV